MAKTELYRGFTIAPDNIYGYTLIDPRGGWCTSKADKNKLKEIVDEIKTIDEENKLNPRP